jgi:hypothetical protein
MNNYMLPTDDEFVETVARAIARDRLHRDASAAMQELIGVPLEDSTVLEGSFDRVFEALWRGTSPQDMRQKGEYRADARAAIAAINLKMLTSTE